MWKNIKVIIIGLFISCILLDSLVMPLILPALRYFSSSPIFLVLWVHFAIFVAGIYVGISKEGNKLLLAAIIGLLYSPIRSLIFMILGSHRYFDFNLLTYILNILKYGLLCVIFAWLSNIIYLKFKKE